MYIFIFIYIYKYIHIYINPLMIKLDYNRSCPWV